MKECLHCKTLFEPTNKNQKHCTRACSRKIRTKCSNCQVDIVRNRRGADTKYFCGRLCSSLYSGTTIKTNCRHCDKEYMIKSSKLNYGYGKFCDKKCHNESMKRRLTCICPNCGDSFETGANEIDRRIYCKKECFYESMMLNISKDELEKQYINDGLTTREIALIYNTNKKVICDYLHKYEIDVRPDTFPNKNLITCKNGQVVRSNYERAFLNEMLTQGIDFIYEPRLPFDKRYSADFLVNEVYIEIWGMVEWDKYKKRMLVKKNLYKKNNKKLFNVYPEDFKDVRGKVEELKNLIS